MLSCVICTYFIDFSYDGNAIHKLAVSAIHGGWIPFEDSSSVWQEAVEPFGAHCSIWIDHYPQGTWDIAAGLYACTGSIETGKAYTLIAAIGTSTLLGAYLRDCGFSLAKSCLVAIVAAVNPITVAQFLTYYNDAFLMLELLALLTGLTMIVDWSHPKLRPVGYAVVASAFLLCTETKFTGLGYAGVFCLSFYIYAIVKVARGRDGFNSRFILKLSLFFLITIVLSVSVFGFSPYIMNLIGHGHPFYPLFGDGAQDIMTSNSPASYADSNNVRKLFLSFFSQSSNILAASGSDPQLKIPFSIYPQELKSLRDNDLRIGGFGVLYGGILIIQTLTIVVMLPKQRRSRPFLFQITICYLVPTVVLMFALGESWWARYCVYFYFVSCVALVLLLIPSAAGSTLLRASKRALCVVFALLLMANTGLFFVFNTANIAKKTLSENKHLTKIEKAAENGKRILIEYDTEPGAVYALIDRGIPFELLGQVSGELEADGKFNRLHYKIEDR